MPAASAASFTADKRQPNSARLAKLVIQRRTLALLLVFGVASFLALFAKAYELTITQRPSGLWARA